MGEKAILDGASVLLLDDGWPILAVKVERPAVFLTAIGGKVEAGESQRECAVRETLEETGARLTIVDSPRCIHVDFAGSITVKQAENGAIARVHKAAKSPPGNPWDFSLTAARLRVDVFACKLDSAPRPIEKHPAFLALNPEILPRALKHGLNIPEAVASRSVRIVGGELPHDLPHQGYLIDSLEALFIALGDELSRFLADTARLVE